MRHLKTYLVTTAVCLWAGVALAADMPPTSPSVQTGLATTAPVFTENRGQWPDSIKFRTEAGGATIWFTNCGVYYQLNRLIARGTETESSCYRADANSPLAAREPDYRPDSTETILIKALFVETNPQAAVEGNDRLEYRCNFFLGNDQNKWAADVPNYRSIVLRGVYPGIDVHFEGGRGGSLSYRYETVPGADLSHVKVHYEGVETSSVDEHGVLAVETKLGRLAGVVAEPASGKQLPTELSEGGIGSPSLDATGAQASTVELTYSTCLGGSSNDICRVLVLDDKGNAYLTGHTQSPDFPTKTPYQTYQAGVDIFVTKLSGLGTLEYSTYIGGSGDERGMGVAVYAGYTYVTGYTYSTNFPTVNPYQADQPGSDGFVAKLSSSGNSLLYSTYLGGSSTELCVDIAVDAAENAYVVGYTQSTDFPTVGPFQSDQFDQDAFVTKLSAAGNSLVYSTYLGGMYTDYGYDIAVNGAGEAYVVGSTNSWDFPVRNRFQAWAGSYDAFVTKFTTAGDYIVFSTPFGGSSVDNGNSIAIDAEGHVYITGDTQSPDFPTLNPVQGYSGTKDVYIAEFLSTGDSLVYSTWLGGSGEDYGWCIAVDGAGSAYVTGLTMSVDFPTLNPYQTNQGTDDAFVSKLPAAGGSLIYSTYLGGSGRDDGRGIAVDGEGNAFVSGWTESSDFPLVNAYQTYQGYSDAFATRLWLPCCTGLRGNINGDAGDVINVGDLTFLVNFLFKGGATPPCAAEADCNADGSRNVTDLTLLVNYIFRGGAAPRSCP